MSLNQTLTNLNNTFAENGQKMPVIFAGHGSPMNAIEDNPFSRAWTSLGEELPKPNAILCVSAHWETPGTQVTAMEMPKTIHDFGGFPRELFETEYPAPGSPALARLTQETVQKVAVQLDQSWGLDHGTWSILKKMYPAADIPVIQFSLDYSQPPEFHYELGKELASLRKKGVLILGSGNIVHNLRAILWQGGEHDWAREFDETIRQLIVDGNHTAIVQYQKLGRAALLSIPTKEHYLPLLYILALQQPEDSIRFFSDQISMGSLSMRSVWIG